MIAFLLRRFAFVALLVFLVASGSFLSVHLAPGDYFTDFGPGAERRAHAQRAAAGLDQPLAVQYLAWVSRALRLDLGTSLKFQRPVRELVVPRAARTASLGATALVLATVLGIPLGVFTGSGDAGFLRGLVRGVSSVLLALPSLVVALALTAAAARSGWLPPGGFNFSNMILPGLALALPLAAIIERTHSQAVRSVLRERFVHAALARGVPHRTIVWKHGMRGALKTTLATYGVLAGGLLSGSVAVELASDWPGLALLTAEAVRARDPFLVCGCAVSAAVVLAGAVLTLDLLHMWADPRVRET